MDLCCECAVLFKMAAKSNGHAACSCGLIMAMGHQIAAMVSTAGKYFLKAQLYSTSTAVRMRVEEGMEEREMGATV